MRVLDAFKCCELRLSAAFLTRSVSRILNPKRKRGIVLLTIRSGDMRSRTALNEATKQILLRTAPKNPSLTLRVMKETLASLASRMRQHAGSRPRFLMLRVASERCNHNPKRKRGISHS